MNNETKTEILEQLVHLLEKRMDSMNKRLLHQEKLMRIAAAFMMILFVALIILIFRFLNG
jgi:formate dehydrogenase maturation protein FdhE